MEFTPYLPMKVMGSIGLYGPLGDTLVTSHNPFSYRHSQPRLLHARCENANFPFSKYGAMGPIVTHGPWDPL